MSEELPPGWTPSAIGALGAWVGGGTPSKSEPSFWTGGTVPWVSPKDMKADRIADAADKITEAAVQCSATRIVPAGSVLVVTRSGILKHSLPVAITNVPVAINQDLKALVPASGVDAEFVALGLKAYAGEILQACSKAGTTVANINLALFQAFPFPLPPLAEQRRIVARIEALFARIRQARADLLRIAPLAARYRGCTLAAEFPGRDALDGGIAVADLLAEPPANGISVRGSDEPPGVRALRLDALRPDGLDLARIRYIDIPKAKVDRLRVRNGDFFVSRGNGSLTLLARGAFAPEPEAPTVFPDTMIRLRFRRDRIHPDWLALAWEAPAVRAQIAANAKTTAGIWKVSQSDIESVRLVVPHIREQSAIAQRARRHLTAASLAILESTRALALLDHLERSILTRAFRGELVPQDRADEPAPVTLASAQGSAAALPRRRRMTTHHAHHPTARG